MIETAKDYLINNIYDPALQHPEIGDIKNHVQSSKTIVKNMKKVGDLYRYLARFQKVPENGESDVYDKLKSLDLITLEEAFGIFKERFQHYIDDVTTLEDFVIGQTYSSWDIATFAKTYNVQSDIYLIPGQLPNYQAIFIKATLNGGKYANEWIVPQEELKYYFFAPRDNFNPDYKYNQAIIQSNLSTTTIYVFIKNNLNLYLTGIFEYVDYQTEADGSKWFRLRKVDSYDTNAIITEQEYFNELNKSVQQSNQSSTEERQNRLATANKKPKTTNVITKAYKRNSDVVAEVLARANGYCEDCGHEAPFLRASNGTPYLEVHHVIPLSKGGDDTVVNAQALCPNCHRKAHFG
ncbi:HNH endonuclease signature motif containing protein [Domibacillus aminovorans]|uniref:HNH endonuclease n=1 Tax=Domibacillus aminovorans TaxID=29332 RepID=UPI003D260B4F